MVLDKQTQTHTHTHLTPKVSACYYTWNPCGISHSESSINYVFVVVTGNQNTTKWSLSASLIHPNSSAPTITPNSVYSVLIPPSQTLYFPMSLNKTITPGMVKKKKQKSRNKIFTIQSKFF